MKGMRGSPLHVQKAPQSRSITLGMFEGKLASLGGVLAAAVLGASTPALAAAPMLQNIIPFGDNRGAPTPPVARYVAVQGQSFVFDRAGSAPDALLKFDDDSEVWVLQPAPAPRGDVIYRNDAGEPVLRITRLGGLTLFTERKPEGVPVSMAGDADDLLLPPALPPGALLQKLIQASARSSKAAQHLITFDAPNVTPQSSPLFSDAFSIAADAIVRLGRKREGRTFLKRLEKVSFVAGPAADVQVSGGVMTIVIAPSKGFAGRPSSGRVIKSVLRP